MTLTSSTTQLATEAAATAGAPRKTTRRDRRALTRAPKHLRANGTAYLMILPLAAWLGIFVIYPLVYAFYLSGFETYYNRPAEFVGLDFYKFVLTDPEFWASLWVGLKYSLMVVPTILVLALLLASFIKTLSKRAAGFLKTTIYVPAVVSVVIASVLFVFIYQDTGLATGWSG